MLWLSSFYTTLFLFQHLCFYWRGKKYFDLFFTPSLFIILLLLAHIHIIYKGDKKSLFTLIANITLHDHAWFYIVNIILFYKLYLHLLDILLCTTILLNKKQIIYKASTGFCENFRFKQNLSKFPTRVIYKCMSFHKWFLHMYTVRFTQLSNEHRQSYCV